MSTVISSKMEEGAGAASSSFRRGVAGIFMGMLDRFHQLVGFSVCGAAQARLALPAPGASGSLRAARVACRHGHTTLARHCAAYLKSRRAALSETADGARATPDLGTTVTAGFRACCRAAIRCGRPAGADVRFFEEAQSHHRRRKTPTSTKSRTSQAEEKLEEMLESGKYFLKDWARRHGLSARTC